MRNGAVPSLCPGRPGYRSAFPSVPPVETEPDIRPLSAGHLLRGPHQSRVQILSWWALKLHDLDLQQRPPVGPIFHCGPPLAGWPSERRGRPRPLWRLNYQPLSPCWALRLTTMAHRPPQATSTSSHGQHCQPPISLSFSCGATQQRSLCGTMRSGLPTILLCTS